MERVVYAAMDLNGLKQVNDTFGHEAGDDLIQSAATGTNRRNETFEQKTAEQQHTD